MGNKTSRPVSSECFESIRQLQRQESLKRQPSLGDSSVADPLLVFPPEVICLIFDLLPPSSLVLACRLVCTSWKQLVDEPQIWQLRMQRAHNFEPRLAELLLNWPQLCINTVCRPNLIKSVVDGKLSLQPWFLSARSWSEFSEDLSRTKQPEQSRRGVGGGGHGWVVEEVPADYVTITGTSEVMKENEGLTSCYVTSFEWCCREQWVDLERAGFSREILDTLQPIIEITEWYCARGDCGSIFNLRVDLLDDTNKHMYTKESNRSFFFSKETAQWQGSKWHKVQHQFKDYGKGVRYVRFADGGKDTKWWGGHYGSKMAGARVRIVFNTW